MIVISEREAAAMPLELAVAAVREAFIAVASGSGAVNPVVIGRGIESTDTFSIKSGVAKAERIVGLKVGSYWAGNQAQGLPAHSSFIFLLDPATGVLSAVT